MATKYGRKIKKEEAEKILNKRLEIVSKGNPVIKTAAVTKNDIILQRFYDSGYNGFIFSEKLVTRFFADDSKLKGKRYLVVLLGAHPHDDENFKEGTPTVLLTGCTKYKKGKQIRFKSYVKGAYPADEHPPQEFFPKFPIDMLEDNSLEFILNDEESI